MTQCCIITDLLFRAIAQGAHLLCFVSVSALDSDVFHFANMTLYVSVVHMTYVQKRNAMSSSTTEVRTDGPEHIELFACLANLPIPAALAVTMLVHDVPFGYCVQPVACQMSRCPVILTPGYAINQVREYVARIYVIMQLLLQLLMQVQVHNMQVAAHTLSKRHTMQKSLLLLMVWAIMQEPGDWCTIVTANVILQLVECCAGDSRSAEMRYESAWRMGQWQRSAEQSGAAVARSVGTNEAVLGCLKVSFSSVGHHYPCP